MIRRVVVAASLGGAVLVFLTATAGPVAAHATLVSTAPPAAAVVAEPPTAVSLTFSAPVDVGLGGVDPDDPQDAPGVREVAGFVDYEAGVLVLRSP